MRLFIETQSARTDRVSGLTDRDSTWRVHRDLKKVFKGLPQFADYRVNRWVNFSTEIVGAKNIARR